MLERMDFLYMALVWMPVVVMLVSGFALLWSENLWPFAVIIPATWFAVDVVALLWAIEKKAAEKMAESELFDVLVQQIMGLMAATVLFMLILGIRGLVRIFSKKEGHTPEPRKAHP